MRELDQETRRAVARNVRTGRELLGLSQEGLGKASGLSWHAIWSIENQKRRYIRPSTMRKLSMALGTSVAEVYGIEEGAEGFLAASPLTSPEALRWLDERAGWEHFQPPAAWLKDVARDDLGGNSERQGRLIVERVRARRDLQLLRREIENSGSRHDLQDRKDWARVLTRDLEHFHARQHMARMEVLKAIEDAMIARQAERVPEPEVFALGEDAGLKADASPK